MDKLPVNRFVYIVFIVLFFVSALIGIVSYIKIVAPGRSAGSTQKLKDTTHKTGNSSALSSVSSDGNSRDAKGNKIMGMSPSLRRMSKDDLAREANVIVAGKIREIKEPHKQGKFTQEMKENLLKENMTLDDIESQEEFNKDFVWTDVALEVEQYLKTDTATANKPNEIVIRTLGGTAGGVTWLFDKHSVHYESQDIGKRILICLSRYFDDSLRTYPQGTFMLNGDKAVNTFLPEPGTTLSEFIQIVKANNCYAGELDIGGADSSATKNSPSSMPDTPIATNTSDGQ
jgi:hypothetical protein